MLPITVPQRDTLTKNNALGADGRLVANWNMNRFVDITNVSNPLLAADMDDDQYFPVWSVVEPWRPEAGIVKAIASGGGAPTLSKAGDKLTASDRDLWSYAVSPDDKYRYFRSPEVSTATLYLGAAGHFTLPNCQIQVNYANYFNSNKVVIGFENTYVSPKHVTVEVYSGGGWYSFNVVNPTLDSAGRLILYRQADNSWSQTVYRDNPINMNAVRVTVNAVSAQNTYAFIIEVAACREEDLSDDLVEAEATDSISEASLLMPIGAVSSNEANVTLDNTAQLYTPNNTSSDFAPLMGRGVEFVFDWNIHTVPGTAGAGDWKRGFTRIAEKFEEGEGSVTFQLKDSSMVLQEAKPVSALLKDVTMTAAVIYLCHSVGFRRIGYTIADVDPQDTHSMLKFYWADPEKTVWEHLQELSEATQTAFYFDEYDVLQIKTRSAAFNLANTPVWIFDAEDVSSADVTAQDRGAVDVGKLADLEKYEESSEEAPNYIDVKYTTTEPSKVNRGNPALTVVYEPEDTVALRASAMQADIVLNNNASEHAIKVSAADAAIWPYKGMMQIDSEIIRYEGKEYSYYLANDTVARKYIESSDEKTSLDALNEGFAWRNVFTGNMRVKVGGRGYRNSVVSAHPRTGKTYTVRGRTGSGSMVNASKFFTRDYNAGRAKLNSVGYPGLNTWTTIVAKTTTPSAKVPSVYGTTVRFATSGYYSGAAGMVIGCGTNDSGIYVELVKTTHVGNRTRNNELNVFWRNTSGTTKLYGGTSGRGAALPIVAGIEYQLDVQVVSDATNHYLTVLVDGAVRLNVVIPKAQSISTLPNEAGMFIRSQTIAEFGYLYMYGGFTGDSEFDKATYLDLAQGGYRSAVLRTITAPVSARTKPAIYPVKSTGYRSGVLPTLLYDEFGTIAHEVRDFDVKYEEYPAMSSMIYLSNNKQVACTEFIPSTTSAKFTLVNVSRNTAIVSGEDTLTYGADNTVTQKLLVYGRLVQRAEAKSKIVTDDKQIVRYGKSELTVESPWIQTETQADRIGSWLRDASKSAQGEIVAFANPYLQLLDKVGIQDPDSFRDWRTDQYFITAKRLSYDGALSVDFDVRRTV